MNSVLFKCRILFSILVIAFLCFLLSGSNAVELLNHQDVVFFKSCEDFLGDFFNVQRYISENDPYFNTINGQSEKPYLPICYLLMMPFNNICDYKNMSLQDCWADHKAVMSAVVFLLLSLFFFFDSLRRLNIEKKLRFIDVFLLLFSSVFLYTIERGNLIILAVASINYFLAFYISDKKWIRRLGLFFLCLAASIKVYPALFGILLLKDKRYKDILFCICCGLILSIVPFLYFEHGLGNIPQLIDNLRVNSEIYGDSIRYQFGTRSIGAIIAKIINGSDSVTNVVLVCLKILTIVMAFLSVICAFVENRKWVQVALLTMTVMLFPTNSYFYSGMYLFAFITLFMNKTDCDNKGDIIVAALLCLIMNPFQIVLGEISVTSVFANLWSIILWCFMILYSGINPDVRYKINTYLKRK